MRTRPADCVSPLRSWGTVVVAMVSSVVLVLGILWGYSPFTALQPTANVASLRDQAPCMEIGMATNADWDKFTSVNYQLATDTTRDLGIGRIRINANWSEVVSAEGVYDWSVLDMRVDHALNAGLTPLLLIHSVPDWQTIPGPGEITELHREFAANYAEFAGAVADRYGQNVDGYEIWNEPNLHKFWPNPDVAHYVTLIRAAYPAIHAADPDATVISAGLAPAVDTYNQIDPVTFLDQFYALGGNDFADAIGMHPYSHPEMPSYVADWNTFGKLGAITDLMRANGDGDKKLWLTEYGAPTQPVDGNRTVSPEMQAAMIVEAYELAAANPAIGPMFIYTLIDNAPASNDPESHFGIYYEDRRPKPAAAAIQEAIAGCVGHGGGDGGGGGGSVEGPLPGGGNLPASGSAS